MANAICNETYSVLFTPSSSGIPNQNNYVAIEQKSTKVLTKNKQVLINVWLDIQNNCQNQNPNYVHLGGTGSIIATSKKCLCEHFPPFLEGDSGFCNGTFVSSIDGSTISCNCKTEFKVAGQIKSKAT